jgi:hypothetical protein
MLHRIFGPKRDKVTEKWRKLHNELIDLYSSPNIVQVIKSRKNEMAESCISYGKEKACTGFWWGNLRERDHLEDPDVDGGYY